MKSTRIYFIPLTLMIVSTVCNIRNLPPMAIFGKELIFFYCVASILFFIPCALVSAQLSSQSDSKNGIYHWVKEAFGEKWGLTAVWLQWIENVIWYPTLLAFIVATFGYFIFHGNPIESSYIVIASIICIVSVTVLNLRGLKTTIGFSNVCTTLGLIIPIFLIIFLGLQWYCSGNELADTIVLSSYIPSFSTLNGWNALTSIVTSLCGIEIMTSHFKRVYNSQKNYPRALLIATIIILISLVFGSLSIAMIIPKYDLSFVSGIVQSFEIFLSENQCEHLIKYIVIAIVIGSLATLNNWLTAPIEGLYEAAKENLLPKVFTVTNEKNVPVVLLFSQTLIVLSLIGLFSFFDSINTAYWFLTVLTSQLYMLMYILMFLAFIKTRKKNVYSYTIPGGNTVSKYIALLGIMGCLLTILVGFIPLKDDWSFSLYIPMLLTILIVVLYMPQIFYYIHKRSLQRKRKLKIENNVVITQR